MSTPSPKYFCPRCRAAYDADCLYCGRCGADMHRASRLTLARQEAESAARTRTASGAPADDSGPVAADAEVGAYDRRAADPWLGRVVDGRYRVIDAIGRGGMGVVYKVEHQRMGKIAAMKVLHRELAGDREVIRRFHREAETVSRLTHPNTVQVFDFGVAQGAPYLVMEYVRGLDLGSLLDRDGPLTFARAAPLMAQICAALGEAHDLGVVHRDLKPENILVTRAHSGDDFVKVLDFGLAKLAERDDDASVTSRGTIVGTPYYMAPEQIRGEDIDARTDLYSLGALMYRVLTGEPPYQAKTPVGVLTKHLTEPLVPPSRKAPGLAIPPEVDRLVERALAKQPGSRFQSAASLLDELERTAEDVLEATSGTRRRLFGSGRSATALPELAAAAEDAAGDASERMLRRADLDVFERSLRRRRRLGVLALPALALAAAGAAYYAWIWRGQQPQTAEREPNDDDASATPIGPGTPVTGLLGRRISTSEGDRDTYRLTAAPPSAGAAISAWLSAPPNIDVELVLVDRAGLLVARVDEGGVGQPERLHDHRLYAPALVVVQEARPSGSTALPVENVSDRYELVVELAPLAPGRGTEPDDRPGDANDLPLGVATRGFLDRREDVDLYRFGGPPGRYHLAIEAPAELPLRWSWQGLAAASDASGGGAVELTTGAILRIERTDVGGASGALPAAIDRPYTVELRAAR